MTKKYATDALTDLAQYLEEKADSPKEHQIRRAAKTAYRRLGKIIESCDFTPWCRCDNCNSLMHGERDSYEILSCWRCNRKIWV